MNLQPAAFVCWWCDALGNTVFGEIYNWFTEGFDTADLKDAKALLDELSDKLGAPPTHKS